MKRYKIRWTETVEKCTVIETDSDDPIQAFYDRFDELDHIESLDGESDVTDCTEIDEAAYKRFIDNTINWDA